MEAFTYIDCDEAIKKLEQLKKKNKNCKVLICTVDFDNDKSESKIGTPEEGCVLIRKSKTVIYNEDTFIPHIQLFSKEQNIENIISQGIMHDIMVGNFQNVKS